MGERSGMIPERQAQVLAKGSGEPRNHPVRMTTASRGLPSMWERPT
jgi:hypothetical protein